MMLAVYADEPGVRLDAGDLYQRLLDDLDRDLAALRPAADGQLAMSP